MRLLIVEDEKFILEPLVQALEKQNYAVDKALDGESGYSLAMQNQYDCIILDLNLPKMSGIDLAKKLRENHKNYPILMLTAKSGKENVLEGFGAGTDDYMTKPFDFQELLFRIQAIIRRNMNYKEDIVEINDLYINFQQRLIIKNNQEIILNNKEYGILEYLLKKRGEIISQEELLEHVWDREIDMFTQTVRTNIKTLRKKIDKDKKIIHTIIGKGYVIR